MNNDWREYLCYDLDYLAHHGILGQKWGVRRFENANGHLTAAGKKRYDGNKVSKKEQRAAYNKKYDEWSSKQDKNDAEWRKVQEMRKGLGKTGITRTINAARNKTDAAKAYNKAYDKWSSQQDKLDKEWEDVKASKPGLSDKQKKLIIAGAAVAGTALAAYGGYKLYQLNDKATKGISNELNKKATANYRASSKLQVEGYNAHDQGIKVARETGSDTGNKLMDLGKSYFDQASLHKDLADQYRYKANSKKYSVKEKYDYLKTGKVEDSALAKLTRSQIGEAQTNRSKLKDTVKNAQTSSKPAQNASKSTSTTYSSGKKTVSNITKISGHQKFSQAAKANDDYVSQMLKKNDSSLRKLDLY